MKVSFCARSRNRAVYASAPRTRRSPSVSWRIQRCDASTWLGLPVPFFSPCKRSAKRGSHVGTAQKNGRLVLSKLHMHVKVGEGGRASSTNARLATSGSMKPMAEGAHTHSIMFNAAGCPATRYNASSCRKQLETFGTLRKSTEDEQQMLAVHSARVVAQT